MNAANFDQNELIHSLLSQLNENEVDALKYRLSIEAVKLLSDDNIGNVQTARFNQLLTNLVSIHHYRDRIPKYGLVYKGRPDFMTDNLVEKLLQESMQFKADSRKNLDQYIYQVETDNNSTYAEQLAGSEQLHQLVNKYAGPSLPSFVTNYLYYNQKDQWSRPHVDNAFTSITVMVGLKQSSKSGSHHQLSSSFIYWPNKPKFSYQLQPGEMAIFFGAAVLHGRTKLGEDEDTLSLLMSFRPDEV